MNANVSIYPSRICPECNKKSVEVGVYLWSPSQVQCKSCGANFKLKSTLLSSLVFWVVTIIVSTPLLFIIVFGYWKVLLLFMLCGGFVFPFYEARYGNLQLCGIRARLKKKGVHIDSEKAIDVRNPRT